jgi:phosphoglycolate phosphatase
VSLVLFDLDGTLTDPRIGITRSVAFALARFGITVEDLDSLVPYIGPPLPESFMRFAGLSADDAWNAVLAYREYYTDTGIYENAMFPGVPAVLADLAARGWRLGVATSKPAVFAERILDHFGLRAAFEVVGGAELDGSRQDKAEVITHALALAGLDPSPDCVMIGDREHDIRGAKRTGLSSIGVTWGYGSTDELKSAGADVIVDEVAGLTAYFGEPPGLLLSR